MAGTPLARRRRTPKLRLVHASEQAADLKSGLLASQPWAERALIERFSAGVGRVMLSILGHSSDIDDLVQEVFIRALGRLDRLHDDNLRSWLNAFAVNVAREQVRRRRRRRWLLFLAPEELPRLAASTASPEVAAAMAALYALLDKMPEHERIAFSLRVIEGMSIGEIALACGSSESTVKRRVRRGRDWINKRAARDPRLASWVEGA